MEDSQERRYERRLNKVFSVYIKGLWGTAFGIARNISEGGMFIETHDPYPLGSRLFITFSFTDAEVEITAVGEVAHICFLNRTAAGDLREIMMGVGVRFVDFFEDLPDVIERHVPVQ